MALAFLRRWFNRTGTHIGEVTPHGEDPIGGEEQFQMGLKFADGVGVDRDYAQAAHWYAQAAEQNHGLAQLKLAMLYGHGQGVARDEQKCLLWLTRSANLGDAVAQYRLGVQQHLACREDQSPAASETRIEALKWVQLSAAQGCRGAASACEFVSLDMTREEVAEGGRRAAAFIAG